MKEIKSCLFCVHVDMRAYSIGGCPTCGPETQVGFGCDKDHWSYEEDNFLFNLHTFGDYVAQAESCKDYEAARGETNEVE